MTLAIHLTLFTLHSFGRCLFQHYKPPYISNPDRHSCHSAYTQLIMLAFLQKITALKCRSFKNAINQKYKYLTITRENQTKKMIAFNERWMLIEN